MGAVQWIDSREEFTEDQALLKRREELERKLEQVDEDLAGPISPELRELLDVEERLIRRYIGRQNLDEHIENALLFAILDGEQLYIEFLEYALEDVKEGLA